MGRGVDYDVSGGGVMIVMLGGCELLGTEASFVLVKLSV